MAHIGRIQVLEQNEDLFKTVCKCPHCGSKALYGDMFTVSGIHGCPNCQTELNRQLKFDRETDYNVYVRKANSYEYEPYRSHEI